MPIWDASLETGHPQIDAEHRAFFEQLRSLRDAIDAGAGRERTIEMILLLQRYAIMHFAREEVYMRRVSCPALEENAAAHGAFLVKLDDWLNLLTITGSPTAVLSDVHRESTAWIKAHIAGVDCQLRGCRVPDPEPSRG